MPANTSQYQKEFIWQYRLRDRLKVEQWIIFEAEIQQEKEKFIVDALQTVAKDAFRFILENAILTEEFRASDLQKQTQVCSNLVKIYNENMVKIAANTAKKWDETINKSKAAYDVKFDEIFEKAMIGYQAKCAADPQFRIKTEQQIREQLEKLPPPEIPKPEQFNIKSVHGLFGINGAE